MINNLQLIKQDWQRIILGIRMKLNLSQAELGNRLRICRQSISRFEAKQRIPNSESINKIVNFIIENSLDIKELMQIGNNHSNEHLKREKIAGLKLGKSEELAELIGIILGDGEIMRDGTIRISFDPKKDKNFLKRRVFLLIKTLLNNKIGFESYKRISFGNIAFTRYLKNIDLIPGSKFENQWKIPVWCFEKQAYITAILRGLFDTDGYFGYLQGSLEIMLGRFSEKSHNLVRSISAGLSMLNISHSIKQCNDKRYKVRISNKIDIIRFFNQIGTSNLKHIVRFLLWRINKYEAKIEFEGLGNLIIQTNKLLDINIECAELPFFWNLDNKFFYDYIKQDLNESKGAEIRNLYKWATISKNLIKSVGNKELANKFNITNRSVRKWREGTRNPSNKFILKLIKLSEENNLNIDNYKVK